VTDPSRPEPLRGPAGIRASIELLATAFPDYRFESTEPPYRSSAQRRAIMQRLEAAKRRRRAGR
jgi:hypothetical protein